MVACGCPSGTDGTEQVQQRLAMRTPRVSFDTDNRRGEQPAFATGAQARKFLEV
jgi:hypothetical protein